MSYLNVQSDIWNPLNAFLALAALIITTLFYFRSKQKKELSYTIISNTDVVNVRDEFAKMVDIHFLGTKIKTFQVIELEIINSGNSPIKKEDFEEPITFFPIKGASHKLKGFFEFQFPETKPKGLHLKETIFNKRMGIEPLLLNSRDSITVKILNIDTTDKKIEVDVQGRIVGVKRIEENNLEDRKLIKSEIESLILALLGLAGVITSVVLSIRLHIFNTYGELDFQNVLFILLPLAVGVFISVKLKVFKF